VTAHAKRVAGCSGRASRSRHHRRHARARHHRRRPAPPANGAGGTATGAGTGAEGGGEAASPAAQLARRPAFFAASSVWNAPLGASAALDPNSAALVAELQSLVNTEVSGKWGPFLATAEYSTPVYTVPATQPMVAVQEENEHGSPALQAAWDFVPIPAGAQPAKGRDAQMTIWQPSTDRLWEFWHMSLQNGVWHAPWGGAMQHVSESPGYFTPSSWSGAQYNWGATASSLPLVGGLITLEDLARHEINHALSISLPVTKAGVWSWPAQRTDGGGTGLENIPEGARFRLDPTLNIAALPMSPLVRMMAVAAQRYGIVVHDKSGVVDFYGQDPTPTGTNPWPAQFGSEPLWQMLAAFPWAHLQALLELPCSKQPCPVPAG
jgi:hypothetical protein